MRTERTIETLGVIDPEVQVGIRLVERIVVAFLVWRGWRIPLGRGRFMKRRNAWRAILAAAAFSLFLSFGRDLFDLIVALIAPPAW